MISAKGSKLKGWMNSRSKHATALVETAQHPLRHCLTHGGTKQHRTAVGQQPQPQHKHPLQNAERTAITRSGEVQISTNEYKIKPIKVEVRRRLGSPHLTRVPTGVAAQIAIGISVDLCRWFVICPSSMPGGSGPSDGRAAPGEGCGSCAYVSDEAALRRWPRMASIAVSRLVLKAANVGGV